MFRLRILTYHGFLAGAVVYLCTSFFLHVSLLNKDNGYYYYDAATIIGGNSRRVTEKNVTMNDVGEVISRMDAANGKLEISLRADSENHGIYPTGARKSYFELRDEIESIVESQRLAFESNAEQSKTIRKNTNYRRVGAKPLTSPSIRTNVLCRQKCCVETIPIGLDQDDRKLLNWRDDAQNLADIMVQQFRNDEASVMATNLYSEDLIPCFLPNTIISVDNFDKSVSYFWQQVRPKIRVPFVLLTSGSDEDTPFYHPRKNRILPHYVADPLLVRWYGTNPKTEFLNKRNPRFREHGESKFSPMLSGLSYLHPQERYLSVYLERTNYTNPFSRIDMEERFAPLWRTGASIDFERDVFVHFGRKRNPFRQELWNILCPDNTSSSNATSCHGETNHRPLHDLYSGVTGGTYRFGISPPGMGYDCYRHYEMWYLGIVPVIWERDPESHELYQDLPVVQLGSEFRPKSRRDLEAAIQACVQSPAFRDGITRGTFERGWERLFFRNKRRSVLDASNRKALIDDSTGREYYMSYRYYLKDETSNSETTGDGGSATAGGVYCYYADTNCAIRDEDGADRSVEWVDDPNHEHNLVDREWIETWNDAVGQLDEGVK